MKAEEMVNLLKAGKFPVQDEKETQVAIENMLQNNMIVYRREWKIGKGDIPDFVVAGGIVIEVKIKGRPVDILRQCERYMKYDIMKSLILVTNKISGFPDQLNGKQVYVVNMGKAWL